ncbi:Na+/H+ antiporter NhaC family protein [Ferviditalea candida]|uniref:Na+/H+ antiporter NhaC family protein n=1 Tax=Ferviditalea candida TaxID=3108399 RepID=A0ABU5ZFX2_9BACL|nr:Na+/H+ antiporter NhaC family protein [Paenibacillaceae bacterium T2]
MLTPYQFLGASAAAIGGLALAYIFDFSLAAGFSAGLLMLVYFAWKQGARLAQIRQYMASGAGQTKEVIWILILVGLIIPAWTASGTITYMVKTGLCLMDPTYFLVYSFVFSAIVSMILGTSTGTLSALGIPLIGMAAYLHIPLPMAAGALVSGAFVGDRTSPFSSARQLTASSTGVPMRRQGHAILPTTLAALTVSVLFYLTLDLNGNWGISADTLNLGADAAFFRTSPILLIPPALLLLAMLIRLKTRTAFFIAIGAALIIGTILQGVAPAQWARDLWYGFERPGLAALHGKGVSDMLDLILLIAMAGAFSGLLEYTGTTQPYARRMIGHSPSLAASTWRVALFGLGIALVSCTQTLPIMMSGRTLLPVWSERFPKEQLARVVADTGLVFAAMIPWNMLAVLCSTILNVPTEQYVPYAAFLWSMPVLTFALSMAQNKKRSHLPA